MAVRMWVPDEARWGAPRTIARNGTPPHAGRVFDVEVATRADAEAALALALAGEPDPDKEPDRWVRWRQASKLVRELPDCKPLERVVHVERATLAEVEEVKFTGRAVRQRTATKVEIRGKRRGL